MRPRRGVNLSAAITKIESLQRSGGSVEASANGSAFTAARSFTQWADEIERASIEFFEDARAADVQTPRYWTLVSDIGSLPAQWDVLRAEIRHQTERLARLAEDLRELAARMDSPGRVIVVPDTNVLLHYRLFKDVKWDHDIARESPVLLAIPLRVIDELDARKASREGLARRARTVVSHIRDILPDASASPVSVRDGVTMQVVGPIDLGRRYEPLSDADAEILDTAESLTCTGKRVVVVTGDYGMQVRAALRKLETTVMPEALYLPLGGD